MASLTCSRVMKSDWARSANGSCPQRSGTISWRMDRRVPGVDGKTPSFSLSRRNCICSLWLAGWIVALVPPRLSADITLVSRLSDARAFADIRVANDAPAPQMQTDFLPAALRNSAEVHAEQGVAG